VAVVVATVMVVGVPLHLLYPHLSLDS